MLCLFQPVERSLLYKYDEEIEGLKKEKFVLGNLYYELMKEFISLYFRRRR